MRRRAELQRNPDRRWGYDTQVGPLPGSLRRKGSGPLIGCLSVLVPRGLMIGRSLLHAERSGSKSRRGHQNRNQWTALAASAAAPITARDCAPKRMTSRQYTRCNAFLPVPREGQSPNP